MQTTPAASPAPAASVATAPKTTHRILFLPDNAFEEGSKAEVKAVVADSSCQSASEAKKKIQDPEFLKTVMGGSQTGIFVIVSPGATYRIKPVTTLLAEQLEG